MSKTEVSNQSDTKKEEAEQLKNQANDDFKKKEYDKAIEFYTKAIEAVPKNAVYYANRSLAHLRQESFGFALQDAASAVQIDPAYLKGYYRRAAAQMSLGKFKKALSDFEYVAKRRPNDEDAKLKFTECNKMVKKQAFERAIAVDVHDKTLAEMHSEFESIVWDGRHMRRHFGRFVYKNNNKKSRKHNKYKAVKERNFLIIPFAVETLGPWGREAIEFADKLGDILNSVTGEIRSKEFKKRNISQHGNSACIMGSYRSRSNLNEVFYIR